MTRAAAGRLLWAAAALILLAVLLQALPIRVAVPNVPQPGELAAPSDVDPSAQAAALLTYEEIVRANPLGPSRQPPEQRYVPPALQPEAEPTPAAASPRTPRLRLFGVATGPNGAVALIDANPSIPGAEIYRLGDLVSGYRLEAISESVVVLRGQAGTRTLRLDVPTGRSR
jgi:hypothetical protein